MPASHLVASRRLSSRILGLLAFGILVTGSTRLVAQPAAKAELLPPALEKVAPQNLDDLRAIQKQVHKVLDRVVPAVVGIAIGNSAGSGVIISSDGYVITAGHVSGEPNQNCILIFHDGKRVKGKTLGRNKGIDSGLIKITEENKDAKDGKWPFVDMGNSTDLAQGQWVIAIGHPGGYKPGRSPVVRLGRILAASGRTIRSDCTLVGGDSGGPLFDMTGKVVGIHSSIGATLQHNEHVPVNTYKETWDRLVSKESWNGSFFGSRDVPQPYLGLRVDVDNAKSCKVLEVTGDGPASKAGFRAGDTITKFDGRSVRDCDDLSVVLKNKKPGEEVEVEVKRGDDTVALRVTLGKR